MFKSWMLRIPCKVKVKPFLGFTLTLQETQSIRLGFMVTLQETQSIHDSMNIPNIEFITYVYIYFIYLIV